MVVMAAEAAEHTCAERELLPWLPPHQPLTTLAVIAPTTSSHLSYPFLHAFSAKPPQTPLILHALLKIFLTEKTITANLPPLLAFFTITTSYEEMQIFWLQKFSVTKI